MDVLESGRLATITDPTGAALSLWQPKSHIGATIVNKPGAMCWNELYTPDIKKAKDFYGNLFVWEFGTDKSNDNYTYIMNNGRSNGGMIELGGDELKGMPPHWMVYFTVEDIEKAIEKTKQLGGTVDMGPKELENGGKLPL